MATVQRLQNIICIYSRQDYRIYALKFLDKDYLDNFIQSASGLVNNNNITSPDTAAYYALEYINNNFSLNASLASSQNSSYIENGSSGIVQTFDSNSNIVNSYTGSKLLTFSVLSDFHESGSSGGGGSGTDYTDVLEDINNNLTNLNTNITNKNNQSDIVQVLKDIFINKMSGSESSVFKVNTDNDAIKSYSSIPVLLFRLASLISSDNNYSYYSSIDNSKRALDNISKKLSLEIPNDSIYYNFSIRKMLFSIAQVFLKNGVEDISGLRSSSLFKDISDKLANANDLHTISQAIDLISTAIAQTPTTDTTGLQTELGKISTAVNNIENNPLFELNANVNGIEVCKKNNKNELDF